MTDLITQPVLTVEIEPAVPIVVALENATAEELIAEHENKLDPHPQYSTDIDLTSHTTNTAAHIPSGGLTNNQVSPTAAIAWSKIDKTGAAAGDVGAASALHEVDASIHVPEGGISNNQVSPTAAIAWSKIDKTGAAAGDVGAASALHEVDASIHVPEGGISNNQVSPTAAIAWSKIDKTGAAAGDVGAAPTSHTHQASDITGLTNGTQFPKTTGELSYTFTQSSNNPAGSYATLTDGTTSTGAGTTNEGGSVAWLQADLGTSKFIEHFRVQGGSIPNWGSTSTYFDNVTVETSDDASNWMQIHATNTVQTSDSSLRRFFCGYVKARYLRFRRTGYLALAELRIWGFDP